MCWPSLFRKPMNGRSGGSRGGGRGGGRRFWGCISNSARVSNPPPTPTATPTARGGGGGSIDSSRINISRQHSLGVNNHGGSDEVLTTTAGSSSIQVKSSSGQTKGHQSDMINMNQESWPLLRKSDQSGKAPVSRQSKQKEVMTQPPKPPTSLFRSSGSIRISELGTKQQQQQQHRISEPGSKQQQHTATTQTRLAKTSASSSRVQEKNQSPKTPSGFVENGRSRTSSPMQQGSNTALQRKEIAQSPKNVGTSSSSSSSRRFQASVHSRQTKELIQSSKDSEASVKKGETSRRVPIWKQSPQKEEKPQPRIGTNSGVVISSTGGAAAARTNPSKLVTPTKQTSLPKPEQKQHTNQSHNAKPRRKQYYSYRDYYANSRLEPHIEWEGFNNVIEPLGKSCLLCEKDLAYEPEYDPNREQQLNPAGNALLPCGHVFHDLCLQYASSEDNGRDPVCMICASLEP